jgi:hypothetical protein
MVWTTPTNLLLVCFGRKTGENAGCLQIGVNSLLYALDSDTVNVSALLGDFGVEQYVAFF